MPGARGDEQSSGGMQVIDREPEAGLCHQSDIQDVATRSPQRGDRRGKNRRGRRPLVITDDNRGSRQARAAVNPVVRTANRRSLPQGLRKFRCDCIRDPARNRIEKDPPQPSASDEFALWCGRHLDLDARQIADGDPRPLVAQRALATRGKSGSEPSQVNGSRDRVPFAGADVRLGLDVDWHHRHPFATAPVP
jgi:hypothetical protein